VPPCPRQCLSSRDSSGLSRDIVPTSGGGGRDVSCEARGHGGQDRGSDPGRGGPRLRVSTRWVYELCRRFDAEGEAGLEPRSRRPHRSPQQTSEAVEDEIVGLRKELSDLGLDAGAQTITVHLERRHPGQAIPSVATIWRILSRRGFVTPQPHKRPRSSFVRFEAAMPNERWQADITHWQLADGTGVEILNVIDDHSRFLLASVAGGVFKAADVVAAFHAAASANGLPASVLTDNGAVFTAMPRKGRCAIELETARLGIRYHHSSPYHPQTCGKVERAHQTVKRWLAKHEAAATVGELQAELDRFRAYYNDVRPHRAIGRSTPAGAFASRPKATPSLPGLQVPTHVSRPAGQGRHHRCDHASSQLAAPSHRARSTACGHARVGVGRRAAGPGDHRGRRADPGAGPRPRPRLSHGRS
jgi:transposase InsO family protein